MRKVILAALTGFVIAVCANVHAQGTVLFTWHGSSNLFQASFEVTAAEMQPGAEWNSPLFLSSMSVTNPLGFSYHGGDSSSLGGGGVYPDGRTWYVTFQLNDYSRGTEVLLGGQGSQGLIHEKPFSGPDIYFEPGYWTYAQIPEPNVLSLLSVGSGLLLILKKRRGV
jgi:hypothetical protein